MASMVRPNSATTITFSAAFQFVHQCYISASFEFWFQTVLQLSLKSCSNPSHKCNVYTIFVVHIENPPWVFRGPLVVVWCSLSRSGAPPLALILAVVGDIPLLEVSGTPLSRCPGNKALVHQLPAQQYGVKGVKRSYAKSDLGKAEAKLAVSNASNPPSSCHLSIPICGQNKVTLWIQNIYHTTVNKVRCRKYLVFVKGSFWNTI